MEAKTAVKPKKNITPNIIKTAPVILPTPVIGIISP